MTISKTWILGIAAVVILLGFFIGYELLQEHDARLKAESVQAAQAQVIKTNQDAINKAQSDQIQTANDLKAQIAAISNQRTIIVTPQQAASVANTLPNLPQQVTVQQVPATPTAPATSQIVIPAADIPAFQKYKLDCDESSAKLFACGKDKVDLQAELDSTQNQFKASEINAASWEATAKGGTLWHRIKHDAIIIGVTGITAYGVGRLQK